MSYIASSLRLMLALVSIASAAGASATDDGRAVVRTEHVKARVLSYAPDGVGPSKKFWLGLEISHEPEWHTYWRNPGDSGLATSVHLRATPGVRTGEIIWPTPKKMPIGPLANYGYEGTMLLPVAVELTSDFKNGAEPLAISMKATWLVCKEECIPEEGEFTFRLPLGRPLVEHARAFEAAFSAQPRPAAKVGTAQIREGSLEFTIAGLPPLARGTPVQFFVETPDVIETAAAGSQRWQGDALNITVPLAQQRSSSPSTMYVVVANSHGSWRSELSVQGQWPGTPAREGATSATARLSTATGRSGGVHLSFTAALLGALVGGLILNLMPCVFPVLAIKMVGFAQHSTSAKARRLGAFAYALGVVASFVALGAILLAFRSAGEQLGWGFHLQSPLVVASFAALFTLLGLNLVGVFEFGSILPSRLATFHANHPVADSFASGVLAVAVASPCTAPFMGASLGLAVTLPAWQAMPLFAVLGLGMALPYMLAVLSPSVASRIPRPGAWMDAFKRFMAFPMFATTVWLVWVLGQQAGVDGAVALLVLLLTMSMLIWSFTLKGRTRTVAATFAVFVSAGSLLLAGPTVSSGSSAKAEVSASRWHPWEPGKVESVLASGSPVFVDFTAAWCITCQYNKRMALADSDVLRDFSKKDVTLLRADWTNRDPAITDALAKLNRSGVPVYVLYQTGRDPIIFSEILSVEKLRLAIASI